MNMSDYNNLEDTVLSKFIGNKQYIIPREVKVYDNYIDYIDFETICEERIHDILNMKGDRELCLLWSGGLDSTLVFYLLLRRSIKFKVLMTEMSEIEYFTLFHKIKSGVFENVSYEIFDSGSFKEYLSSLNKEDFLCITGDGGDQVFNSNLSLKLFKDIRHIPYRIAIPKEIYESVEDLTSLVLENPINATIANWCWSLDFIFRWNVVNTLLSNECGFTKDTTPFISFFHDIKFENFSVTNQVKNNRYNKFTDKKDIRDLIIKISGDEDYVNNKTKIGSQKMFYYNKEYIMDYYSR